MRSRPNTDQNLSHILPSILNFMTWTALFAIAYAQSPLFTSNQNQYFLHGLARAGYGYLASDWLANTLDPTPIFSTLVSLTYAGSHSDIPYYIYYALLMGIYLFSLLGIINHLFDLRASRTKTLLILAALFLVHSAGLRFLLSRTLGVNWTYVLEDGFADQRMLGPVFQPSAFGVFLMLSVYLFMNRKRYLAITSAVLAATLHPTYLLSAALLTSAFMLVEWRKSGSWMRPAAMGAVAMLLVAPILIYVSKAFMGTSPQISTQAQEILVNFRIPHHARIAQWFDATALLKILILFAGIYLARQSRLFLVMLAPAVGALALTAIQILLDSNLLALIFPWRISTLLVPLSTAIVIGALTARLPNPISLSSPTAGRLMTLASAFIIFIAVLVGGVRFVLEIDRKSGQPEEAMYSYVNTHKRPEDVFLIPVKMQDFRLETGAPVYVDFKSIPYKDIDVLEWRRRIQLAENFYQNPDCNSLGEIFSLEPVNLLVISSQKSPACPFLQVNYQDEHYTVLRQASTANLNMR